MAVGQYQSWKGKLLAWGLVSGVPVGLSLRLALFSSDFVFDQNHSTLSDLVAPAHSDIEVPGVTFTATGQISAPELDISGLTAGEQISALVLYWKWDTGDQLFLYTTESAAQPLPVILASTSLKVKFPAGVYQL